VPGAGDGPYVFPHPFRCGGSVVVQMDKPGRAIVSLLSPRGVVIARHDYTFGPGNGHARFDCTDLPPGLKLMVVDVEYDDGQKVRLKPIKIAVTP
jgi:hypothetical protein